MNKRAQVSIFIIVALVLVVGIILFFLLYRAPETTTRQDFENPESFIDVCMRDQLRETIATILPQGGFVNPTNYKIYNDIKATYLCNNINYYEPCIMQYPLYLSEIEEEIETALTDDAQACFTLLEEELTKRNYDYAGNDLSVDVTLKPGIVELTTNREFTLQRNDVSRSFDSFSVFLQSPLYDLASIAQEIAAQESRYCYFEYVGYQALHPEFDIRKTTLSDSTTIYTIIDKQTGNEMNIAIRGCAIPPGF